MKRRESFTLIELLVVMGIIGLLVALLFPAIGAARLAASRTRAQQEAQALVAAIEKYMLDYQGRYPGQTASGDKRFQGTEYQTLVNALRGLDNTLNPRREIYLSVQNSSIVTNTFVDPWDRPYEVIVDGDFNRIIALPPPLTGSVTGRTVVVWSRGPDGTNINNFVRSWE